MHPALVGFSIIRVYLDLKRSEDPDLIFYLREDIGTNFKLSDDKNIRTVLKTLVKKAKNVANY